MGESPTKRAFNSQYISTRAQLLVVMLTQLDTFYLPNYIHINIFYFISEPLHCNILRVFLLTYIHNISLNVLLLSILFELANY